MPEVAVKKVYVVTLTAEEYETILDALNAAPMVPDAGGCLDFPEGDYPALAQSLENARRVRGEA